MATQGWPFLLVILATSGYAAHAPLALQSLRTVVACQHSSFGRKRSSKLGVCSLTSRVEMGGIEPPSSKGETGILRAQPIVGVLLGSCTSIG